MRSVRLGEELEAQLDQAARLSGVPVSNMIREAVRRRCAEVLSQDLKTRLADVLGAVAGRRHRATSRDTGRAFTRLLKQRARSRR